MKKIFAVTAVTVAMGFISFANAATPASGNPGTVRFIGEIVSGACGIDANSMDQTVSLGQVPSNSFKAIGDRSTPVKFDITLTDCDTSTQKTPVSPLAACRTQLYLRCSRPLAWPKTLVSVSRPVLVRCLKTAKSKFHL